MKNKSQKQSITKYRKYYLVMIIVEDISPRSPDNCTFVNGLADILAKIESIFGLWYCD
jgi:hypothetical protein